jgi:hypothetical protein
MFNAQSTISDIPFKALYSGSCEKWSIAQSEGGEEYRTYSKKKKG